jgi:hypothetical protein
VVESGGTGAVYAEFMHDQLTSEETRKVSLEQRGLAVITSSGVLATFSFGALALFKQRDVIAIPRIGTYMLLGSAITLLIAATLALAANSPLRYRAINPSAMARTMREHWADGDAAALARVTSTRAQLLVNVRSANDLKAIFLLAALIAEVLGVAFLAITVCVTAIGSP